MAVKCCWTFELLAEGAYKIDTKVKSNRKLFETLSAPARVFPNRALVPRDAGNWFVLSIFLRYLQPADYNDGRIPNHIISIQLILNLTYS